MLSTYFVSKEAIRTCAESWFITAIAAVIHFITVFVQLNTFAIGACELGHGAVCHRAKLTRFVVAIVVVIVVAVAGGCGAG